MNFKPTYYNTRQKNNLNILTNRTWKSSKSFSQVGSRFKRILNKVPIQIIKYQQSIIICWLIA